MPALRDFYMPSFSTRTLVYKGLLLAPQVESFYDDLRNPLTVSALALVHQRFSTNTFPSWRLAHPYRFICHNGEINTVRGNTYWMAARRQAMSSELLGADLEKMVPLIGPNQSDTACLDNALELLVIGGGYSLAHAMMMLIPEAWSDPLMDPERRAFYEYHAALMEPWDGPAAIAFTDGRQIGATLDRNGLRPARYIVTDDDHVIMASESRRTAGPGGEDRPQMAAAAGQDAADRPRGRPHHRRRRDQAEARRRAPVRGLAEADAVEARRSCPIRPRASRSRRVPNDPSTRLDLQQAFGYTTEDIQFFLEPMAQRGRRPGRLDGHRHADRRAVEPAEAALQLLQAEFRAGHQPADRPDPRGIGDVADLDDRAAAEPAGPRGRHASPARSRAADPDRRRSRENPQHRDAGRWPLQDRYARHRPGRRRKAPTASAPALDRLCAEATAAVEAGHNILILSDRAVSAERVPIPALLATSAVHHHLIRQGLRTKTGIVVETGEAREVHHFCVLAGYGAEAINPYLAFATLEQIRTENGLPLSAEQVQKNYLKALGKGILKVISKMGISTYQSYCGAQIFDAVGLQSDFVEKYFTGTATTIEGADLRAIAEEALVAPRARLWRRPALSRDARSRRRLCLPAARRGACLDAADRSPNCSTRCAATRSPTTRPSRRRSTTRASGC